MTPSRRSFVTGLISFAATAPAIVRASSLMPVKQMLEPVHFAIDYATGPDVTVKCLYWMDRVWWISGKDQIVHMSQSFDQKPFCTLNGTPIYCDDPLAPASESC
jgi:hypothetical protein